MISLGLPHSAHRGIPSHLMGFFYRTIRMVENGIKPAYVFDGKPPELKAGVVGTVPGSESPNALIDIFSFRNVSSGEKRQRKKVKRRRKQVSSASILVRLSQLT